MMNLLLHPWVLISIAVLVVNDQLLKAAFPGTWWTGKLSDFAGLAFFPIFLLAGLELLGARASRRLAIGLIVLTGVVFASIELLPQAELVYRYGLGALQYPFRALAALSFPTFSPVEAYADPTDCFALGALVIPFLIISRRFS